MNVEYPAKQKDLLYWILVIIAAVTVLSGLLQVLVPGVILELLSAQRTATADHFFGIVGMFMALFGGMMLNALLGRADQPVAVLWGGLQKLGAVAAVSLGVVHGIFASVALWVASMDLVSGILALVYWRRITTRAGDLR
jgi:hypothetical protein